MKNNLIDKIQIAWAKSDGTTIKAHTDRLLENLKILKDIYGKKIESACPESYKDKLWDALELACQYHDYGKLHWAFQHKVGNKNYPKYKTPEVKHSLLSPAFLPEDINKELIGTLISLAIIHHHEVNLSDTEKVKKILEEEFNITLQKRLELLLSKDEYSVLESQINSFKAPKDETIKFYQLLKGLLLRIDHASSSQILPAIEEEALQENDLKIENYINQKYNGKLNDLQNFVCKNIEENLIIVASTGYGKTEAGFIFLKEKGFFTIPIKTSVNSIYLRGVDIFGSDKVGLLHSTALNFLMEDISEDRNKDINQLILDYESARHFSKPLIISTPDQIFPYVFRFKGFEKYYSLFAHSRIVIDEIQLFEPYTLGFLVSGLKYATEVGAKVMVMTATMPEFVKKDLQQFLKAVEGKFLHQNPRHNIKLYDKSILSEDSYNLASYLSQNSKVLIVTNTVKRAVEIYNILKQRGLSPEILHSRFILKQKKEKEERIKDFFNNYESGIWITTQLAEVSLDLDADYLITELSTLDSLFQRLGRVNRRGIKRIDKPNVFVFLSECSGIGPVYRKSIHTLSKEKLREGIWNEDEKVKTVENLYSKEVLQQIDPDYFNDYKDAKKYIEDLWKSFSYVNSIKKDKAQQLFRDIKSINVIPKMFKSDVQNIIEQLNQTKKFSDKVSLINKVLNYSFSIPGWANKKNELEPIERLQKFNLYWINTKYDEERGLFEINEDPELPVII